MGKKKTVTVTTRERDIPDDDAEIKVPEVDVQGDDLDGLLGLNAGGHRYTVHKEPSAPGGKRQYCCTYTSDELSLDAIRDDYGGGAYRITGFDENNRLTTSKRVDILEPIKPPVPANNAEYLARGERSGSEALTMLTKMFESQSAMLSAVLSRPPVAAPAGPTAMELVALIKALQPTDKGNDPVASLLQGLELGQKLGGGGETGMMDVAMKGLGALAPLIAAQAAKPAAPAVPAPAAPQRLPHPSPPLEPQKTGEEMLMLQKLTWLKAMSADLCQRAAKGKNPDGSFVKDPELYAEVMLDNLPSFLSVDEIYERMQGVDAIAQLAQINPTVTQYAEWFQAFRQAVLDSISPDDDEMPPDDADGGGLEP
jgi:hypothetical protein